MQPYRAETEPRAAEASHPTAAPAQTGKQAADNGSRDQTPPTERYRRLPTGAHGLARAEVERDQRERLRRAMIELIAERGYPAVRIADLTKLAHVSRPTFYALYPDKEQLVLSAYEDIAARTTQISLESYTGPGSLNERLHTAMEAFLGLSASEPDAMSLFLFGAFGAGPEALERRARSLEAFERSAEQARDRTAVKLAASHTVKVIFGGVREITAARLREGRAHELSGLVDQLTAWSASYPRRPPEEVRRLAPGASEGAPEPIEISSKRARAAQGRLPGGRHDLPREVVVKSQRERIVDATAAIVAEKGLANLTIPEIASRAGVSHETFYEMYRTKHDAYLGAQKIGMHQAFSLAVGAYEAHKQEDWSLGVAHGVRTLIDFLWSEPAHAHLSIVDTFAASPETLQIRDDTLRGFAVYLSPGERPASLPVEVPDIAAEAVVGGIWQVLHYFIERNRLAELPEAATELVYLTLAPFLGPAEAASVAVRTAGS